MRRLCVFALALACLSLAPLSAQASPSPAAEPSYAISESELIRSLALSSSLEAICARLETKLASSEESLARLETELAELRPRLESSVLRSLELETTLEKAESSLEKSRQSFGEYKAEAESLLRRRDNQAGLWRAGALMGGAGALGALVDGSRGLTAGAVLGAVAGGIWWYSDWRRR